MQKKTLKELWKSISTTEKDTLRIKVASECGKSIDTVQAWMLGYREPSRLEKVALYAYIRRTFRVEITE